MISDLLLALYPLGEVLLAPKSLLNWPVAGAPPSELSPSTPSPQGFSEPRAYNVGGGFPQHLAVVGQKGEQG